MALKGIKPDGTSDDLDALLIEFTKKWGPLDSKIEWWGDLYDLTEALGRSSHQIIER